MESPRNPMALIPEECWERILTILPHLFRYLENNDLLTCRQVSKSWKVITDRHLEEGQFLLWDPRNDDLNFRNTLKLDFSTLDIVERVELHLFGDSTRNPIPSRALSLFHGDDFALDFLRKFGAHIWHLTVNYRQRRLQTPVIDFITAVREYLVHTPNLRTLILSDNDNFPERQEQVEDGTVRRFYAENPLPPLLHLHSLVVCLYQRVTEQSTPFEKQLVSAYASNLGKLQFWQYDHILLPGAAPNLTHLNCTIDSVAHLNALENFNAPLLQVLTIWVNNDNDEIAARDLFRAAERFGGTLTELILGFDSVEGAEEFPVRVELPILKSLSLMQVRATSDTSFDFLEHLSQLRNLEILFKSYEKMEVGEPRVERVVINEHLGTNGTLTDWGMYLSNIWTILPRLEKIRFFEEAGRIRIAPTKTFWRHCYEYLHDELQRMNIM